MEKTLVSTPLAELSMIKENILLVTYTKDIMDMDSAIEHVKLIKDEFYEGTPLRTISDLREVKKLSKDIRGYFSSEEVTNMLKASAILTKPGLSMVIGSFMLRFGKTNYPVKLFSKEEKAIEWLREH